MPYYLVAFDLGPKYFNATPEERNALTAQEIAYGMKLFKVGLWKHAYTMTEEIKAHSWAIYKCSNEADLDRYLDDYPMKKADMYTSTTYEVKIVDPPWIVGLLFAMLRLIGLYKPWKGE